MQPTSRSRSCGVRLSMPGPPTVLHDETVRWGGQARKDHLPRLVGAQEVLGPHPGRNMNLTCATMINNNNQQSTTHGRAGYMGCWVRGTGTRGPHTQGNTSLVPYMCLKISKARRSGAWGSLHLRPFLEVRSNFPFRSENGELFCVL